MATDDDERNGVASFGGPDAEFPRYAAGDPRVANRLRGIVRSRTNRSGSGLADALRVDHRIGHFEARGVQRLPKLALLRDRAEAQPGPADNANEKLEEQLDWIKLKVVDDETGDPVPGVQFRLIVPGGEAKQATTPNDGVVEIDRIPAGECKVDKMVHADVLFLVKVG